MDQLGVVYLRMFMHAAMISHWAMMFEELVSTMITNFLVTPSIAIPALANIAPPPTVSFLWPLIYPLLTPSSPMNPNWSTPV